MGQAEKGFYLTDGSDVAEDCNVYDSKYVPGKTWDDMMDRNNLSYESSSGTEPNLQHRKATNTHIQMPGSAHKSLSGKSPLYVWLPRNKRTTGAVREMGWHRDQPPVLYVRGKHTLSNLGYI